MALVRSSTPEVIEEPAGRPSRAVLFMQLSSPDADSRRNAAIELAGDSGAIAELLAQLADEEDYAVRQAIVSSLSTTGGPEVVQGVMGYLRSEDAGLRNDVIELLKEQPDAIAPYMPTLLADADQDVRIFAVNILESLKHPKVVDWLIAVIETDPHINVCATAVDLLAEVGDSRARVPLARLEVRFADEPFITFAVAAALDKIAA